MTRAIRLTDFDGKHFAKNLASPVAHRNDPSSHSVHMETVYVQLGTSLEPVRLSSVSSQSLEFDLSRDIRTFVSSMEAAARPTVDSVPTRSGRPRRLHSCMKQGLRVRKPAYHSIYDFNTGKRSNQKLRARQLCVPVIAVKGCWMTDKEWGVVLCAYATAILPQADVDDDDMRTQVTMPSAFTSRRPDLHPVYDDDALTDDSGGYETEAFGFSPAEVARQATEAAEATETSAKQSKQAKQATEATEATEEATEATETGAKQADETDLTTEPDAFTDGTYDTEAFAAFAN